MLEGHQSARSRARRPAALRQNGSVPEYLQPSSIAAVRELAELIAAAEWAPSSYRGVDGHYVTEKIVLGIMHGAAVGLGPFAAVHAIAVIDGHPTIWGDGALALVERSGLIEDMREDYVLDGEEGLTAVCTMRRRSWPTPIARRFSTAMADGAGLTRKEGPWQTYPRRMLMMRARSWALRDGFADVLRGLSIREEVEDYDTRGTALAEPLSGLRQPRAAPQLGPAPRRPRLADYIAAESASGSRNETKAAGFARKPVADARAVDSEAGPSSALTSELAEPTGCAIGPYQRRSVERDAAHMPAATVIDPAEASMSDFRIEDAEAASPYVLVDADGNFIELTNPEALRVAFDDLFADRSLSPDQIIGLWESNDIALHQLIEAFGEAAVEISVARFSAAADKSNRPRSLQPASQLSRSTIGAHPFLAPIHPNGVGDFGAPELKISPTWSDEKVLHHYQSHLLKMRLRRAPAAAFVNFRLANQPIEDRLRTRLPNLMGAIDEVYTWASTEAR
jgi:hypothetical protein